MARLESLKPVHKIGMDMLRRGAILNGNAAIRLDGALNAGMISEAASMMQSGTAAMGKDLRTCCEQDSDSDLVQP